MPNGSLALEIAVVAVPVVAAIVLHEISHGAVAHALGDPTAALAGRLSLNPLRHVDPVGTVLLPGLLLLAPLVFGTRPLVFGWAKPVPVDPRRLGHPRRDMALVAIAGPTTNLLLAGLSAVLLALVVPPTDEPGWRWVVAVAAMGSIQVNCALAIFNLLPIPPLDGGNVLLSLLPQRAARALFRVQALGYVALLLVVFNSDVLTQLVRPVVRLFVGLAL